MKNLIKLFLVIILASLTNMLNAQTDWISLFNGKNLSGWFVRGDAKWSVDNGILAGEGSRGHIYTDATATDFEFKGMFRISGRNSNSGLYFRANPPADNPDGFPRGYEAQLCHSQEAFTGWLWKPGTPTGKASRLLTQDNEWFNLRIKAVGPHIIFWVNDEIVMTHYDEEYTSGHFAIQVHHEGMKVEAKELYYR